MRLLSILQPIRQHCQPFSASFHAWLKSSVVIEHDWPWTVMLLMDRRWTLFCFGYLLFALAISPEGSSLRLCAFHVIYGVDCPGCGTTRALSCLWRGRLLEALSFHPFSPLVFAGLFTQSIFQFLPDNNRRASAIWLTHQARILQPAVWICLIVYGGFGLSRAFWQWIRLIMG